MKPVRFFALFLFSISLALAAADDVTLPERLFPELDRILHAAVEQSPTMLLRNLDLEISEGDLLQAQAGRYPSAGGYGRFTKARDDRQDLANPSNVDKVFYDISISQALWRWNTVTNNARMGEIRNKIVEHQYEDGYRLLAHQIRSDYLGLIVSKIVADAAKFNQGRSEDELKVAEDRFAKGTTSGGELFFVRMNLEQARLSTDRAFADFEQARRSFSRLTGQPMLNENEVPAEIPVTPGGEETPDRLVAAFLSQGEPKNLNTLVLRKQLEVESLNLEIQRKRLFPMVNFIVGVNQDEYSYTANVAAKYRVQSTYAGLSVSWSIFDGFASRGAVRGTLARKRQLEMRYRQLTENLAEGAQRQAKVVRFSLRQMRINDLLFDDRRNFLQAREDEMNRGTASEADVNFARAAFNQSRITAFNGRAGYLMQMCDLLGTVMEDPVLRNLKTLSHE